MTDILTSNSYMLETDTSTRVENAVHKIIEAISEDPDREGLVRTPQRVARMYAELTAGYQIDLTALVNGAVFHVDYTEMITVTNIDFSSLIVSR